MSLIWMEDAQAGWTPHQLTARRYRLSAQGLVEAPADAEPDGPQQPEASLCCGSGDAARWALLAAPEAGAMVNGTPLCVGIRVLHDRDELVFRSPGGSGSRRFYFSVESVARVEPFPGESDATTCPRCRKKFKHGQPAVRCPNPKCGVWHHQMPEEGLPCWTYAQTCAACPQPTATDAGYLWTPEEL